MAILSLKNVHKTFFTEGGGTNALQNITLEIREKEFLSIIGPSGCGKSTLLRIIAALEKPESGEVIMQGDPVSEPGPDRAMIFQDGALFPWMTVLENVSYGLKVRGMREESRVELARNYLRLVHLDGFADASIHQLSGGMKQRVALLRALVLSPQILLMDEPFIALDTQMKDLLVEEVRALWTKLQNTVILVTHDIRDAVYLSDRIVLLSYRPGKIKNIYAVEMARPRDPTDPEMERLVFEIVEDLHEEVEKAIQAIEK